MGCLIRLKIRKIVFIYGCHDAEACMIVVQVSDTGARNGKVCVGERQGEEERKGRQKHVCYPLRILI